MYKTNAGQASLFDDPANFIGARLNPNNRWVQMSSMIPWDLLDEKYNAQFGTRRSEIRLRQRVWHLDPISSRKNSESPTRKQWKGTVLKRDVTQPGSWETRFTTPGET